jgi:hypothetical protein
MKTKEERKQLLRDWMTAATQLYKVENPSRTIDTIASFWRAIYGIKMRHEWVKRALYGGSNVSRIPDSKEE